MNARDWALIAFTIMTQMSVGSLLVLGVVHYYASRKAGMEEADRLSDRSLLAIVVVLALAMLASLFHLGNPLNAPRAVTNLATSWLSWEILFGVIFAVVVAVFALMQWRKSGPFGLRNIIAWIAALVGLALVYSQSRIYMLVSQPAWNTLATPILFYATTLLLGSLAMGAAFVANYAYVQRKEPGCADVQCELMRGALRWIAIASIILVGVELIVYPLYLGYLASNGSAAASSAKLMVGPFGLIFAIRLVLAFLGAGVFGVFLYQNATSAGKEKILSYLAYSAFVIVLVSEVMGRLLFYATSYRIGV
jgi:anaerobic dimethyl sulfoxide reductase subunit C (anchor subunit)